MPVASKSHSKEIVVVLVTTLIMAGIYALLQSMAIRDWWKGLQYAEPAEVGEIRQELALTDKGTQIFLATQPAIETATDFNEHCNSHRVDISLLGCYTGDKMYIYEVNLPELKDSNKVTAAHELLHAVWLRMDKSEKEEVKILLQEVQNQNADWVKEELELYKSEERLEELYTRVGTKLRDLPEALEKHYQKYFQDRQKIVDFYENYQAPFTKLIDENKQLKAEVAKLDAEIETGRTEYLQKLELVDLEIAKFNQCADTLGCFKDMTQFQRQRSELEQKRMELDTMRNELNAKIDYRNAAVIKYQENQEVLGELSGAMNSNVERIE